MLLLVALLVGSVGNAWGADELFYTLTPTNGTNNSYAGNCDVTIGGITWNITGNSQMNPWRIGGSSITKKDRTVYSKTAMSSAVTKVELTVGAASSITVNSLKLIVASDASFSSVIDEVTKSFTANSTITFTPTSPATNWASGAYYKFVFNVTVSGSSNKFVEFTNAKFYRAEAVAYEITVQSNNNSYGTVSLDGSTITASPEKGYRVIAGNGGYTVTTGTATVTNNGDNTFSVTPSTDCTVTINFEAIPTYTVTFKAKGEDCGSATETIGGAGVVLPSATIGVAGWEFIGWAADAVDNTTTQPTLYKAGSTYYPTSATTLHAVYTLKETTSTFVRVTSVNQVEFAKSLVVVKNSDNFVLNHSRTAGVAAPEESAGEITAPANTIFTLSGNNTDGFVLTGENGTLSQTNLATSGSDKVVDWSGNNNQWKIEENANATNTFALSNATNVALEYYSGWKTEYSTSYNNRAYTAMKLYVPKSAYDSNPSALTAPTVEFDSTDPVTLYLDGTTTNTNTATVTGVSKTINYSSSNTSVATVTSAGVVTAEGIGTATITASVDAELGVSTSASDTYTITVKSGTTLAGIKAQATSSTAVDFTADLASDLVITYVNGSHAYLQSGDVAVYASCATGDWEAGKKFTGAITGKVKVSNNEYQITAIDQTPVAGGVVPDAIEVAITDLTTANYATYEGRKIAINGATVNTKMTSSEISGGKITTDGANTLNIYAREKGITLTKDEKGNFVGYIGRYNDGIRYYMYEQNQFTKTHNAPQDQVMSFTNSSYNLDEETDAVTDFAGQEVTKTTVKGAVTYSIKDGSDDIITSLNSSTGAVVLKGDCGTATIVATAAAYDEYDEGTGYYTPYKELAIEYSVTVRPRYTVTFSINGNTDEVRRQESYGAAITVPDVAAIGDYVFLGWSDTEVATTDVAPTMTTGNSITPTSTKTIYAVFANQTQTGTTDVVDQEYSYSAKNLTVGGTYTDKNSYYLLHEGGYVESAEFDLSIITKIEVTGGTYGSSSNNKLTISDGANKWKDVTVSTSGGLGTDTYTGGAALSGTGKLRITSTCGGATNGVRVSGFKIYKSAPVYGYSNYTTSLSTSVTIGESHYLSYCFMNKLDFSESNVKAYKASVDGEGKVTLIKVDVVPAGEGVVLYCETPDTYSIPVTTKEASDVTGNEMVGVLVRTQVEWNPEANVYNYILQQGEFRKATTPGGYLKPNRAYLSTSYKVEGADAKPLTIIFAEEETDGIRSVGNTTEDGVRYNLSGQKVGRDYKGIVIINGKKVIRK